MDFKAILNEIYTKKNKSLEIINEFLNNTFDDYLSTEKETYIRDNSLDININNWDNSNKEGYVRNLIDFYTN